MTCLFRAGAVLVECVAIQDAFGPTITRQNMDALVVSGETRSGGQAVNERRFELGWKALKIYEVDVLDAKELTDEQTENGDFVAKISSTAIREQRAAAATSRSS
jgi:phosphopantetheine adenylyltransferase